ncbi:MAG: phosphoadenylyl-sulfate reductase [Bacteroidota bacterium]
MNKDDIKILNKEFKNSSAEDVISYFLGRFKDKITFASSLGIEDQVITDMIMKIDKGANIFTLDTGRLFPETYDLIQKTNEKYGIKIQVYFPSAQKVEQMVNEKGINLFYDSIENRKLCCGIRKIEPLKRAFHGKEAWICGLRQEQSITRFNTNLLEFDESNGLLKINPLFNWVEQQVWDYIKEHDVPYNKLHDKGFPSIGCQPCTRAIENGEDIRAGRWWWEQPESKECGLHKKSS